MRSTWGLGRGKRAAQECNGKPKICNGKPEKCARMRKNAQENLRALLDILCFMFASMDSQVCLEVFNFHIIYIHYMMSYTFFTSVLARATVDVWCLRCAHNLLL